MPQLNPDPWLFIFTFVWLTYLLILLYILNLKDYKNPMIKFSKYLVTHWKWPQA